MNREKADFLEAGPDYLAEAAWEILASPHDLWGNPRTDMSPQQRQRQRMWLQALTEMLESKSYEQIGRELGPLMRYYIEGVVHEDREAS